MRAILLTAGIVCALTAAAQEKTKPEPAKPELTAEQIIEKSIEASGGRKAMEKMTSMSAKATMENTAQSVTSDMEIYLKAPNKRLIVVKVANFGEFRQGFDGAAGWTQMPMQGLTEVTGDQLAAFKRESVFNAMLHWREMYPKATVKGKVKVGDRDAYALEMTPADGRTETHYFDAESFLMIRQKGERDTPQGPLEITSDFQDYRDMGGGVRAPFLIKQSMSMGDIVIKMNDVKFNPPLDDAMFSKPAAAK